MCLTVEVMVTDDGSKGIPKASRRSSHAPFSTEMVSAQDTGAKKSGRSLGSSELLSSSGYTVGEP